MTETCAICRLHQDPLSRERYEISRSELWLIRHHPDPTPLPGWLLLDSMRHCGGPLDFEPSEAQSWGGAVRDASRLVQQITGCDRVYAIAFGEGAPHLHLHLIPRFADDPATSRWQTAPGSSEGPEQGCLCSSGAGDGGVGATDHDASARLRQGSTPLEAFAGVFGTTLAA